MLLLLTARAVAGDGLQSYVSLQSINYSRPVSISAALSDWGAPFKGGDKALTYNRAEVGVVKHGWQLGVLARFDYLMTFSEQTAKFYYLTINHLPLEAGNVYPLQIKANSQFSRGLRLGYQRQWLPSLKAGAAVTYLQGIALTDGSINGSAEITATNDYNFQFDTSYVYSRDALFSRTVQKPQGRGFSLDVHVDWRPNDRFSGQLTVLDLLGKLYWDNAPYTIATATSDTKTYDADGYVRYKPVISGLESNRDFIQSLPRKIFLASQYQMSSRGALLAEWQDLDIARFFSFGVGWRMMADGQLSGLYNFTARAFTLRYQQHHLQIEFSSDQLNSHDAHYLALDVAYRYAF